MCKKLSVSLSHDKEALKHDSREYCPANVKPELIKNDVFLKTCPDIKTEFNELFANDVTEYNKGKRSDRKILDYYEKIAGNQDRNKAPKPLYEYVIQYGSKENNSVLNPEFRQVNEDSRDMLIKVVERFRKAFPNFYIVSAVIHMDEQTPHLHIAFIPVATGYKNGMNHQCSLTKALENMGYKNSMEISEGKRTPVLALTKWQNELKDIMTEVMEEYGYEREYMNNTDEHMSMTNFKHESAMKELCKEICSKKEEVQHLSDEKAELIRGIEKLKYEKQNISVENRVLLEIKKKELIENSKIELERMKCELEKEYNAKEQALNKKITEFERITADCLKIFYESKEVLSEIKNEKTREDKLLKERNLKRRLSNTIAELQSVTGSDISMADIRFKR